MREKYCRRVLTLLTTHHQSSNFQGLDKTPKIFYLLFFKTQQCFFISFKVCLTGLYKIYKIDCKWRMSGGATKDIRFCCKLLVRWQAIFPNKICLARKGSYGHNGQLVEDAAFSFYIFKLLLCSLFSVILLYKRKAGNGRRVWKRTECNYSPVVNGRLVRERLPKFKYSRNLSA
jgi:hypothetical protein